MTQRWNMRGILVGISLCTVAFMCIAFAGIAVTARRIDGSSMEPTLLDHDRVLVDSAAKVERFAVIIGKFSEHGPSIAKRVIGLPGDVVSIEKHGVAAGSVRIQPGGTGPWQVVKNPAWDARWNKLSGNCCASNGKLSNAPQPQTVPPGMLFVLGDNVGESEDSRMLGWAPMSLIEGVIGWRVYPLDRVGKIRESIMLTPAP